MLAISDRQRGLAALLADHELEPQRARRDRDERHAAVRMVTPPDNDVARLYDLLTAY